MRDVAIVRDWLGQELWHSPALLPACRGVWQALRGISRNDPALRLAREKLSRVVHHVHGIRRDTAASQLRAAKQIKLLAEEVLQLFGADEGVLSRAEPDYGMEIGPQEARGLLTAARMQNFASPATRALQAPFKMVDEAAAVLCPGRPSVEAVKMAAARILPLGLYLVLF